MITINGKYNTALVMIDDIDDATRTQIQEFVNHPTAKGTHIAIMSDCHFGAGCVVGYTATMGDYVIPNLCGVDIGCGVDAYDLGSQFVDFPALDQFVRDNVPSGFNVRETPHALAAGAVLNDASRVCERLDLDLPRVIRSLGTLGGGNHFIELDRDLTGHVWLVIHSGSRNFGHSVATYWQKQARAQLDRYFIPKDLHKGLEFFFRDEANGYLKDAETAQRYAALNRKIIAAVITQEYFGVDPESLRSVKSVHNYIDLNDNIVRKGAISAHDGEEVVIPLNMRDGTIIGKGKSGSKWNYSAPHGAGRLFSRKQAKLKLNVDDFKAQMQGVWSSSIGENTLDEAPDAYKAASDILESIGEIVDIEAELKPIYSFKAS